jgi:Ca2+-binding RTX toxin-like protein
MAAKRFGCLFLALTPAMTVLPPGAATPARTCGGLSVTIAGTAGPDRLRGTRGRDVIHAGPGDDVVSGRGAADVVCGGAGADRLAGGRGHDVVAFEIGRAHV